MTYYGLKGSNFEELFSHIKITNTGNKHIWLSDEQTANDLAVYRLQVPNLFKFKLQDNMFLFNICNRDNYNQIISDITAIYNSFESYNDVRSVLQYYIDQSRDVAKVLLHHNWNILNELYRVIRVKFGIRDISNNIKHSNITMPLAWTTIINNGRLSEHCSDKLQSLKITKRVEQYRSSSCILCKHLENGYYDNSNNSDTEITILYTNYCIEAMIMKKHEDKIFEYYLAVTGNHYNTSYGAKTVIDARNDIPGLSRQMDCIIDYFNNKGNYRIVCSNEQSSFHTHFHAIKVKQVIINVDILTVEQKRLYNKLQPNDGFMINNMKTNIVEYNVMNYKPLDYIHININNNENNKVILHNDTSKSTCKYSNLDYDNHVFMIIISMISDCYNSQIDGYY